jgi:hypothetical protein
VRVEVADDRRGGGVDNWPGRSDHLRESRYLKGGGYVQRFIDQARRGLRGAAGGQERQLGRGCLALDDASDGERSGLVVIRGKVAGRRACRPLRTASRRRASSPFSSPSAPVASARVVQHRSLAGSVRPVRLGRDGNRFPQVGVPPAAVEPVGQLTAQVVEGSGPRMMTGRCRLGRAPRETRVSSASVGSPPRAAQPGRSS